jgi:hypothetical protein
MSKAYIVAAALAAALGFAAPAGAVSLTFHVSVTSASGVDGFVPYAFDQTWTFTPNATNAISGAPPFPGFSYTQTETWGADDGITVTPSDYTAGLLTATGLVGATPDHPEAHLNYRQGFDGDGNPTGPNSAGMIFGMTYFGVLGSTFTSYHTELGLQSAGPYDMDAVNLASLVAFIQAEGPVSFQERATAFDSADPIFGGFSKSFEGTATLTSYMSDAPEPAVWALLIAGFGLAGGTLRRRAKAAA